MHRCKLYFFYRTESNLSNFCVIISEIKRKRFVFNHMRLFYFREKLATHLRHGGKTIKKHIFQWKNLFTRIILLKRKLLKYLWKRKKMGKTYKMLNAWLRNCRNILAFMKKEIKDIKTEKPQGKCLESSWAVFNKIFMNNKEPSHILKGHTFFFITFTEKFITQIT